MLEKRLLSLVPGCGAYIAGAVILRWVALVANIVILWSLADVVAATFAGATLSYALQTYAIVFAACILVRVVTLFAAQRISDAGALRAKRIIRMSVYQRLSDLGPSYGQVTSTAEAIQTAVEGAQQLEVYFGGYLPQFVYAFVAPLTLFAALVGVAGLPATVLLVAVPLIPGSIMMVMKNAKKIAADYWDSYVDLGGTFLEAVEGLTTLKVFQADGKFHERMNDEAEGFRKATMRMLVMQLRSIMVMDVVAYGGAALGIIVALVQLHTGSLDLAAALLVIFLSVEFFLPMRRLGSLFHAAMNGTSAAKRMYAILDAEPLQTGTLDIAGSGVHAESISISFDGRPALEDLSLELPATGFVGLVGRSGSGKSTFANLLSGRICGYEGSLKLGDTEIRDASTTSLCETVTLVDTRPHLFEGTVRDNLLMARPDATDAELWQALKAASVDAAVEARGGLDAHVADNAANFSGGQKARLAMARAILHDARVYVFDETCAAVDAASEAAMVAAMKELAKTRLVVSVSHRLASVADADLICVLDHGRLDAAGTHAELMAQSGVYAQMYATQEELSRYADATAASAVELDADDAAPAAEKTGAPAAETHMGAATVLLRMVGLVKPLLGRLLLAIALGTLGSLAATFVTTFGVMAVAADAVAPVGIGFVAAIVLVAVCGIVRGPLHYGEQLMNHDIAFRLLARIRDVMFGALRKLAPARLEGHAKGDLVSVATSDIELLEVFYAHTISPIAIALLASCVMLGFVAALDPSLLGLALAGYLAVGVALPLVSGKACGRAGAAARAGNGALNAYVLDSLRGMADLMQYGACDARARGLESRTEKLGKVEASLQTRSAVVEVVADALILALSIAMVFSAAAAGTPAAVVAALGYMASFGPVLAVGRLGTSLQATVASGERVLKLLDEKPVVEEVETGVELDPATVHGASAHDVSFSYADGTPVLDGADLSIEPGEMAVIAGPSGCGKSTLVKLMMRFYDPSDGSVRIGGTDARDIETASLRENQGYVAQETHLFEGTLRENLLLGNEAATDEEIARALEDAALSDFVARLDKGLDTPVGELGSTLSGGERQRLGLARVFLHDANLVLLDEPTSNLDALSEAAVMKAIADKRAAGDGATYVLVSHRASTCGFADKTFNLAKTGAAHGTRP
jgi:ATP-binding cassette subfamily B protein